MNIHNCTVDVIRVIAMFGVIFDHYLQQSNCNLLINIGLWIGGGCPKNL